MLMNEQRGRQLRPEAATTFDQKHINYLGYMLLVWYFAFIWKCPILFLSGKSQGILKIDVCGNHVNKNNNKEKHLRVYSTNWKSFLTKSCQTTCISSFCN